MGTSCTTNPLKAEYKHLLKNYESHWTTIHRGRSKRTQIHRTSPHRCRPCSFHHSYPSSETNAERNRR